MLLPTLSKRGIYVQLVTSGVREIPLQWRGLDRLSIVVSVDGLQPEHDARRAPATYARILKHVEGHKIDVHCTVTRQQTRVPGYLEEFVRFWSVQPATDTILMSLYTPQIDEISEERLDARDRQRVLADLWTIRSRYPKLLVPTGVLHAYANPPKSPQCLFARTTTSLSADLLTRITPCQFGGVPDCSNCGCMASAVLSAAARHRVLGVVPVGTLFNGSVRIGELVRAGRERRPAAHLADKRAE